MAKRKSAAATRAEAAQACRWLSLNEWMVEQAKGEKICGNMSVRLPYAGKVCCAPALHDDKGDDVFLPERRCSVCRFKRGALHKHLLNLRTMFFDVHNPKQPTELAIRVIEKLKIAVRTTRFQLGTEIVASYPAALQKILVTIDTITDELTPFRLPATVELIIVCYTVSGISYNALPPAEENKPVRQAAEKPDDK